MIDPAFWQSYTVAAMMLRQRLLFIGLFSNADSQGRLRGHPGLVQSLVFPLDELSHDEIRRDLEAIEALGSIHIYQVDGHSYIQVINWWRYQSPQWAYPPRSRRQRVGPTVCATAKMDSSTRKAGKRAVALRPKPWPKSQMRRQR
jgi:hypothetical protein